MPTKKQLKKRRAELVAALRSGEFQQGRNRLRSGETNDQFCCLGVACELSGVVSWVFDPALDPKPDTVLARGYHMPQSVADYYGFASVNGMFQLGKKTPHLDKFAIESLGSGITSLVTLNDERELTFSQIADVIESNPKDLWRRNKFLKRR